MSILTEEEKQAAIDSVAGSGWVEERWAERLAIAIESAVLAKLAGMELPEHYALIGKEERVVTDTFVMEGTHYEKVYTATQLHQAFVQGAASQLSAEPFAHYRHYDEQVQPFADDGTIPLYALKEPK